MEHINIDLLKSVNGVPYLTDRTAARKVFGEPESSFCRGDDGEEPTDEYSGCQIIYNDKTFLFEAIQIFADEEVKLVVNGIDLSDFDIKKILSLSEDFVYDEENSGYISYSKEIAIWCPEDKNTVETILFGRPNYYQD